MKMFTEHTLPPGAVVGNMRYGYEQIGVIELKDEEVLFGRGGSFRDAIRPEAKCIGRGPLLAAVYVDKKR